MAIMTKRGNLDNIVTYEHICDTYEDLQNIDPKYATLGSTAIVINQEEGLNAYMATSAGEWVAIGTASSGGGEGGGGITPTGTYNITANGTYNVTRYATAKVNVPTATSNLKAITISPSSSQQVVLPSDENCDAFNQVTVESIPSRYIIPIGTTTLTTNGTYDVSQYSSAIVNFNNNIYGNFLARIDETLTNFEKQYVGITTFSKLNLLSNDVYVPIINEFHGVYNYLNGRAVIQPDGKLYVIFTYNGNSTSAEAKVPYISEIISGEVTHLGDNPSNQNWGIFDVKHPLYSSLYSLSNNAEFIISLKEYVS